MQWPRDRGSLCSRSLGKKAHDVWYQPASRSDCTINLRNENIPPIESISVVEYRRPLMSQGVASVIEYTYLSKIPGGSKKQNSTLPRAKHLRWIHVNERMKWHVYAHPAVACPQTRHRFVQGTWRIFRFWYPQIPVPCRYQGSAVFHCRPFPSRPECSPPQTTADALEECITCQDYEIVTTSRFNITSKEMWEARVVSLEIAPATVQEMSQEIIIKKKSQDHLLSGNRLGQRQGREGSRMLKMINRMSELGVLLVSF